ncbi:MAG: tRNA (adenosine(37)-N6)-threonylcarbamoyltransferase complex dimerization subunit type 1 TsaB [Planctomycetota bacterium]
MIVLAIESSGDTGGAAILSDNEIVCEVQVSGPRSHGSELMPAIDQVLVGAKLSRTDMNLIAVNAGPGSYTGLRIGLSSAAGIGYALQIPVVGVNALDAMALQFVSADGFDASRDVELWPVLDARRGEVMTAKYSWSDGELRWESKSQLIEPAKVAEEAAAGALVFGSGVQPYADAWDRTALAVQDSEFGLTPSTIGLQAIRDLDGQDTANLPTNPPEPQYFRRVLAKTVEERAEG